LRKNAQINEVSLAYLRAPRHVPGAALAPIETALPYAKRLSLAREPRVREATLLGVALACSMLGAHLRRNVRAGEIVFPLGGKPKFPGGADFNISHCNAWIACALASAGVVGLDVEDSDAVVLESARRSGPEPQDLSPVVAWVAREATLKALGAGIAEARDVRILPRQTVLRGRALHCMDLDALPGAHACIVTSEPVATLAIRKIDAGDLLDAFLSQGDRSRRIPPSLRRG
jgi:phosphopantetheinyl transferase